MADVVDGVTEDTGADTASLDEWAADDKPAQVETKPEESEQAEEEQAEEKPEPKKGKAADELAEGGGKGKQPVRAKDGTFASDKPKPEPVKKAPEGPDLQAKVKIVVDGEEEEITLGEALRRARKNSAADRRFQEASRLRQEAERLRAFEPLAGVWTAEDIAQARNEVKRAGGNPDDPQAVRAKMAELDVLRQIEAEKMSPEARRAADLERENNRLKAEQKAKEDAAKQAETEQRRQAIRQEYDRQFTAALKAQGMPATPYTVMRMADIMQTNLRMGIELPAGEVAKLVQEDLASEQSAYVRGMPADRLVKLALPALSSMKAEDAVKVLPKDFLDKLRKYDLEQAKAGNGKVSRPAPKLLGSVGERPRRTGRLTNQKDADVELEKWADG